MKCNYPLCPKTAQWVPVIAIPCIRTVGIDKPNLSPLIQDPDLMRRAGLDPRQHIRMYEERLKEWKEHQNDLAHTDKPSLLVGREVCNDHRLTYNFLDWFGIQDWEDLMEGARHFGVILETVNITVKFKPLGWDPPKTHSEMQR